MNFFALKAFPNYKDKMIIAACAFIGLAAFYFIYGFSTLNVSDDGWVLNGYIEGDLTAHYAGWLHFRNSPWTFPLGIATNVAYPQGTAITFYDSIPIFAILFKLISPILPETFQYFGLWVVLCFVLQGISSALLIRVFTKNHLFIIGGSVLFCFSPIMIERAFRHTALASHWLIIFSLYYYFKVKKENFAHFKWEFILLNVLAVCIHPYFLPMTFGITFLYFIEYFIASKNRVFILFAFVVNIVSTLAAGLLIGLFTSKGEGGGFGYFSMNLNAPFNPFSCGKIIWSQFIKVFPQILGNYDGFNYFGLGVLLVGVFFLMSYLLFDTGKKTLKIRQLVCRYKYFIILCLCYFVFAISNVVTFNDKEILQYAIPEFILRLASIFRASSRMFYPVYYMGFLSILLLVFNQIKIRRAYILLAILLIVQLFDIYPALKSKNDYFTLNTIKPVAMYESPVWSSILSNYPYFISDTQASYGIMAYLGKHGIKTNLTIGNRASIDESKSKDFFAQKYEPLRNGVFDEDTFYQIGDEAYFLELSETLKDNVYAVKLDGAMLLLPITDGFKLPLCASNVTDANWTNGVLNAAPVLLFANNTINDDYLESATGLKAGDTWVDIEDIKKDDQGISVFLKEGSYLKPFAYPAVIEAVG